MRQVSLLGVNHTLTVVGYGPGPDAAAGLVYKEVARAPSRIFRKCLMAGRLLLGAASSVYWRQPTVLRAKRLLDGEDFDLVLANDLTALPLALRVSGGAPVFFDAHEYSPREFEDKLQWRLLFGRYCDSLCRRYLPQASGMVTVCRGIADEYARNYNVRVGVVHNAPDYHELHPSPVSGHRIRLIHHGAAIRSRNLECMIEMMKHLDQRFTLDLMLVGTDPSYLAKLHRLAGSNRRISFVEPVPMSEICQRINEYDIGVFLLPPVNFNYRHALPNKFFEFIQARLGVAIGPSPEMAALLARYGCGVVADSFQPAALAAALQGLTETKVKALKWASHRAAHELNFEQEGKLLLKEVDRLLAERVGRK
jgi:hypothetical protein